MAAPTIPSPAVSRLVTYLRIVSQLEKEGVENTSSGELAREAQVSAFQVRKDLTYVRKALLHVRREAGDEGAAGQDEETSKAEGETEENLGKRGTGYFVVPLAKKLRQVLGLNRAWNVAIVGMGRLGEALADYPSFHQYDFLLKAAFDVSPAKIGRRVGGLVVRDMRDLPATVQELDIDIALLTVPADAAQAAADALCEARVAGILNFAPTVIETSGGVRVESVDFLAGLKRLSFYVERGNLEAGGRGGERTGRRGPEAVRREEVV